MCGTCQTHEHRNSYCTLSFRLESGYPVDSENRTKRQRPSSLGRSGIPWLGKGLSMSSPNDPVLCCSLPYRVAPLFVQFVSPPLGWSPLSSFLVIWSPSGDARGPSVVFEALDMPCPGPFHFSHSVDYMSCALSLNQMLVFYLCM